MRGFLISPLYGLTSSLSTHFARSSVSTWSPLATAFNSRPGHKLQINFTKNQTGLFGLEELKSYDGFYLLKENVILESERLIKESCSTNRTRKLVNIFDDLSDTLCRVADLAEFVRVAHPQPQFANAAWEACNSISGVVEKLNTNFELYSSLRDVVQKGDSFPTTEADRLVASLFLIDFEQNGIHLGENDRKKVVALNDYILLLGQRFLLNASKPRSVDKLHLPPGTSHLFPSENNNVSIGGLYSDSKSEWVRESAYRIFLMPDNEQEHILNELLSSRNELAKICGYPTYAHRALNLSIAETPDVVKGFLNELSSSIRPLAEQDFKAMLDLKLQEKHEHETLASWDIPYITHKARRELLGSDISAFSPYFSLGACMEGLNNLMKHLFGITFVSEEILPGESWVPDIYKLAVTHESEGLLGYIYCDFYERPTKVQQDCHFTIRGGRKLPDGSYQNPVVVVMLNVPTPRWSEPSLLSPHMVDNLFHEMGHAMHSMLARTEHQHVAGTRCTTDFAEVPSILMEYFASDPRILRTFARHYSTNEPMPEEMIQRLCSAKHVFGAADLQVQVFYAMLDQVYHGEFPLSGTTSQVLEKIQSQYYGIPYVPNTAWHLRFSHLVGYGAKYYSYLVSRAVASLIWSKYFKKDPLDRSQGEKYRAECLAHGGAKPARALVSDFLGLEVSPKSLASSLIHDHHQHSSTPHS